MKKAQKNGQESLDEQIKKAEKNLEELRRLRIVSQPTRRGGKDISEPTTAYLLVSVENGRVVASGEEEGGYLLYGTRKEANDAVEYHLNWIDLECVVVPVTIQKVVDGGGTSK